MCNHYRNEIRKAGLSRKVYGFEEFSETKIRFDNFPEDVYPDRPAMIGRLNGGALEFVEMRWGFPPQQGRKLRTNTRRIALPFWRPWLKPEYRCLIPFTSFAEWVEGPGGKAKEMWFGLKDEPGGYFAGIWRPWSGTRGTKADPVSGEHLLFSLLTSDPNEVIGRYHDRMPVILPDAESQQAWLTAPASSVGDFQKPLASDKLVILSDPAELVSVELPAQQSLLE